MAFCAETESERERRHLPERIIQAFENVTNLSIVVHDLTARLWMFMPTERFQHCTTLCREVKVTHDWACRDFDITRLRREIAQHPDGRWHVCHAGLLEWSVPVHLDGRLAWVLFAGQRCPSGPFRHAARDIRTTKWRHISRYPPPAVGEDHAIHVLEALRQLRARLLEWHESTLRVQTGAGGRDGERRLVIEHYIHQHHRNGASVAGLARELSLSESRTIHLVKELFGRGYIKLVCEMRLRTAAALLRATSAPILEVCLDSGFQDLSHFHRLFRRHFGVTPLRYRRTVPG